MLYLLNISNIRQYIGKSETKFSISLNKHREDVTRKGSIPISNRFDIKNTILIHKQSLILVKHLSCDETLFY